MEKEIVYKHGDTVIYFGDNKVKYFVSIRFRIRKSWSKNIATGFYVYRMFVNKRCVDFQGFELKLTRMVLTEKVRKEWRREF